MVDVVVRVTNEAELLKVTLGNAERAVHKVHGVVQKERDGRVVAGDEANDALRELRLLKPRAVEAVRLWPSASCWKAARTTGRLETKRRALPGGR